MPLRTIGQPGDGARRVCLATDSPEPSGVGRHMLALAKGACATMEVTLLADARTDLAERAVSAGLQAVAAASPEDWLAQHPFDVVHVHAGIGWEGHGLTGAASGTGARVVRTEHLPWLLTDERQVAEYFTALDQVDQLVAVSEAVASSLRTAGIASERIVTIPNGVDAPRVQRSAQDVRRELGAGGPLLLHVGRFTAQKRHDLLVRAVSDAVGLAPTLVVALAGEGPELTATTELAEALGVRSNLRFLGRRDDVGDLMAAADLLLLPSDFEGLPLVLLEAMASGLAVVATRAPGVAEVIDEGCAWVVERGDAWSLARAIGHALADPAERAARASVARDRHHDGHSAALMQARTCHLYEALLGGEPVGEPNLGHAGMGGR